jgi:alkanesulfonate monooxygenase SsuD/methylene tetrahydromethanopterin reductase-like flavin-dependent oxidoreductase (luciferase family)
MRFGLNLDPAVAAPARIVEAARAAEAGGFDFIGIQDHPYRPDFLDTWTLLGHLAARTERIAVTPNVANLGLRPPAMLAKAAATLAHLSGDRVVLGVGAGAVGPGVPSMGMTGRSGRAMRQYAEESVGVLKQALRGEYVQLESAQTAILGYHPGPVPSAPVEVWMGANQPGMLEVTGRVADGWLAGLSLAVPASDIPRKRAMIDQAALRAGRDPSSIRRLWNIAGTIGRTAGAGFAGSPEDWAERLNEWVRHLGFDGFVFWPTADPRRQAELFALEVIPRATSLLSDLWEVQ